jgi:cob(I)alamin adenosyltransferase
MAKIYTKTGDKGQTSLLTGKRVPKNHPRIEAYGTVDELNAFIGLLRAYPIEGKDHTVLEKIQDNLFVIGSLLAMEFNKPEFGISNISEADISELENEMDKIAADLPKLTSFIIPGGNQAIALSHVCRTVCRRAERICIQLSENEPVDQQILVFLNRLSDYFFMLGRKIAYEQGVDIPVWKIKR